jgi:hypothetical protein
MRLLGGGARLELLIGYTRLGNLLALLDREEVPEIQKHLFGTLCLTPRESSGPPLRAFVDASRRLGVDGEELDVVAPATSLLSTPLPRNGDSLIYRINDDLGSVSLNVVTCVWDNDVNSSR